MDSDRLRPIFAVAVLGSLRAPDSLRESVRPWPPISAFELVAVAPGWFPISETASTDIAPFRGLFCRVSLRIDTLVAFPYGELSSCRTFRCYAPVYHQAEFSHWGFAWRPLLPLSKATFLRSKEEELHLRVAPL